MLSPAPARSKSLPGELHRSPQPGCSPQLGRKESTQARLLKKRGDLFKTTYAFHASLPAAGPNAREKGLGMEVVRSCNFSGSGKLRASLLVADVDSNPSRSTPVADWNIREDRQACRSGEEHHASFAIRRGDKICAVNGFQGDDDAMVDLLVAASDIDSPKPVSLRLQRSCSDVFCPEGLPSPHMLPPRLPTSGNLDSFKGRTRSNSLTEAACHASRPTSVASDAPVSRRSRRMSDPEVERMGMSVQRWSSMMSTPLPETCGHHKVFEDDVSTRPPSVSVSRRSSFSSTCDRGPPMVIKCQTTRQSFFSRAALSTLSR